MSTKFERGEKVRIKSCPIIKSVEGKRGTIVRVRIVKEGEIVNGEPSSATVLYKVRVGGFYIPSYATDDCLEKL